MDADFDAPGTDAALAVERAGDGDDERVEDEAGDAGIVDLTS